MIVSDYKHAGGRHWESVNLRNLLGHAGAIAPHSKAPPSEAIVFGVAGGVGAGYSYCPSIPGHGAGSGVGVLGRYDDVATGSQFAEGLCKRLGVRYSKNETAGTKGAMKHVTDAIDSGRPAMVWIAKFLLPHLGISAKSCDCAWMYSVVVIGIDEAAGTATIGDHSRAPVTMDLEVFKAARAQVCSFKNRSLVLDPTGKITAATFKAATLDGIRTCIAGMRRPRIKMFSPHGWSEWARLVVNKKNKKGWRVAFGPLVLCHALRDVYDSIETLGTGGGLYRPLYAEFLREAATLTGKKPLSKCADTYDALGRAWTELADAALPDTIAAFKQTKAAMNRRAAALIQQGAKGSAAVKAAAERLEKIDAEIAQNPPLDDLATDALLGDLSARIADLVVAEAAALDALEKAAA